MTTKQTPDEKTTSSANEALLALGIEAVGIIIVVTVAGINDSLATMLLVFSVGLWVLYLVMNSDTVSTFTTKITNIEAGAKV